MASPAPLPPSLPAQPNRAARRRSRIADGRKPERLARPAPVRGYVGLAEAAHYLAVAPKLIRKLIADGKLPAYRLGNRVLKVKIADLDAVLTPMPSEPDA